MKSNPFKRAITLMALVQAAAGDMGRLAALPAYESRGKGKGLHSGKKWGPRPSGRDMVQVQTASRGKVWLQKENGNREVLRRQRQLGTLSQVSA